MLLIVLAIMVVIICLSNTLLLQECSLSANLQPNFTVMDIVMELLLVCLHFLVASFFFCLFIKLGRERTDLAFLGKVELKVILSI